MSTPTMRKQTPAMQSNWSEVFPVMINCHKESTRLMKKILALSISNIAFLRFHFPDEAFSSVDFDGMKLKLLTNSDYQPGNLLIQWLKASMSALDKGYLKEIDLIVYKDETREEILEMYKFNVEKPPGPGPDGDGQSDKDAPVSRKDHLYKETQMLFRMMNCAMVAMTEFPDTATLSMKSVLNKDTPDDYLVKGFKPSSPVRNPRKCLDPINVGKVKTLWHKLNGQIIRKTDAADAEQESIGGRSSVEVLEEPKSAVFDYTFPSPGDVGVKFSARETPPKRDEQMSQASTLSGSSSKVIPGRPKPAFFGDQVLTPSKVSMGPKEASQASNNPQTKRHMAAPNFAPIRPDRLDEFASTKRIKI